MCLITTLAREQSKTSQKQSKYLTSKRDLLTNIILLCFHSTRFPLIGSTYYFSYVIASISNFKTPRIPKIVIRFLKFIPTSTIAAHEG